MVPQNFHVLAKLGFCSNCSQNLFGARFARIRTFFTSARMLGFSEGIFFFCNCGDCSLSPVVLVCSQIPFDTNLRSGVLFSKERESRRSGERGEERFREEGETAKKDREEGGKKQKNRETGEPA